MSSLITLVLIVVLCGSVSCNTITTREPEKTEISSKNDSNLLKKEPSWPNILLKRLESINAVNFNKSETNQTNKSDIEKTFNKRKSRFLGSLAFLAGLSVGGLTNAASSTVKAYAKLPQGAIAMNFVPPKVGPYLAAYYDPYSLVPHPYAYQTPLGPYPLLDPFKLQSLIAGASQQSGGDRPTQILALLDNKRPSGSDDGDDVEEYIIEQTKLDKKKPSSRLENRSDETIDSQADSNAKTGEEVASNVVPCDTSKRIKEEEDPPTRDSMDYDLDDLQEDADDSRAQTNFQRNHTTVRPSGRPSSRPTRKPTTRRPHISAPTSHTSTTETPTIQPSESNTTYLPFYGYYDGSPQDISHIDLTSGTQPPIYHEPNPINYNLPYDRPAEFYPDEKYSYYSNAYPSSYPSGSFLSEQLPDYSRNDFDRFLYSPDNNSPPYVNGFKPVTRS